MFNVFNTVCIFRSVASGKFKNIPKYNQLVPIVSIPKAQSRRARGGAPRSRQSPERERKSLPLRHAQVLFSNAKTRKNFIRNGGCDPLSG